MNKKDCKIHIVGAGVSGLIAAQVLESHGYAPVIFESSDVAGGRLKTDLINGYQLDHGFQVLLTAYPMAQKYLDLDALELQEFLPGATIFLHGKTHTIGDPTRVPSLLFPTLLANIGTLSDKIKILSLHRYLQKKSLAQVFDDNEISSLQYLKAYGFTDKIIDRFFRPFFSGIFLEPRLETSSRMFEFVFKMFGSGSAAVPKAGISAIADQLVANLNSTTFRFGTQVSQVKYDKLYLSNGEVIEHQYAIIATEADQLIRNLSGQETDWHSCHNLYFETRELGINKPLIGLIADPEALINNIFYPTSLATAARPERQLLSVTVVKPHDLDNEALKARVIRDLEQYGGISDCQFIKHYHLKKALPQINDLKNELAPSHTRLTDNIFLAGDQMLNGSLNAAMISGERAAMGIIESHRNYPRVLPHFQQ
jgi:protoporphyrinogen oxidase